MEDLPRHQLRGHRLQTVRCQPLAGADFGAGRPGHTDADARRHQKLNLSIFDLLKTYGAPNRISSPATWIEPSRPADRLVLPRLSCPFASASAATTVRYPRSTVFQSTMLSMIPLLMYARHMLGSESPTTFTSPRPDCLTASAAPGTAGAAIPMMSFTFGCTLSTVCVSENARSRSPSLG